MIRLFTITLFVLTLIIPTELWGRGLSIQQTPDTLSLLSPNEGVMQKQESWWKQKSDYTTEFRPTQLIAPATLFAIGALGIGEDSPPLENSISLYVKALESCVAIAMHISTTISSISPWPPILASVHFL